tara:strand:+ start:1046 stop:1267 length:222 start_codon:yes stop_codon:yes gene_type:complete
MIEFLKICLVALNMVAAPNLDCKVDWFEIVSDKPVVVLACINTETMVWIENTVAFDAKSNKIAVIEIEKGMAH